MIRVSVLGALACLVVDDPRLTLLAVDDQQVSDASVPHVLILETTRLQVSGDTHLILAQLLPLDVTQGIKCTLGKLEVLRDRGAITDVQLSRLVETCSIKHGITLRFHNIFKHPQVKVFAGALLKELHATV